MKVDIWAILWSHPLGGERSRTYAAHFTMLRLFKESIRYKFEMSYLLYYVGHF